MTASPLQNHPISLKNDPNNWGLSPVNLIDSQGIADSGSRSSRQIPELLPHVPLLWSKLQHKLLLWHQQIPGCSRPAGKSIDVKIVDLITVAPNFALQPMLVFRGHRGDTDQNCVQSFVSQVHHCEIIPDGKLNSRHRSNQK